MSVSICTNRCASTMHMKAGVCACVGFQRDDFVKYTTLCAWMSNIMCAITYVLNVKVCCICIIYCLICLMRICVHIQANRLVFWAPESTRGPNERQCQEHNYTNLLTVCKCVWVCFSVCVHMQIWTQVFVQVYVCACHCVHSCRVHVCLLVKSTTSSGHDSQRQLPTCRLRAKHIVSEMTDACHTQMWPRLHCGLDIWDRGSLQINSVWGKI